MKAAMRKKIPKDKFAGPGETYPTDTRKHAAAAKSYATQENNKGKLSDSAKKNIDAMANKELKKTKK